MTDRPSSDPPALDQTVPDQPANPETPAAAVALDKPEAAAETPTPETPAPETLPPPSAPPVAARRSAGAAVAGVVSLGALLVGLYAAAAAWSPQMPAGALGPLSGLLPGPVPVAPDPAAATARQEVEALGEALAGLKRDLEEARSRLAAAEQALADRLAAPTDAPPASPPEASPTPAAPVAAVDAEALAALRLHLTALEERLGTVQAQAVDAAAARATEAAAAQAKALARRIDGVEAASAQATSVLSLSDRVTAVEGMARRAVSRQDRALAFLLAVGQLRAAVDAGQGYADALRTVRAVAPPGGQSGQQGGVDDRLALLAAHADSGLPPLTRLRQGFADLAPRVVRAGVLPEDGGSWWAHTVDRLLSVVSVRRVDGEAVGDSAAAIVTRAEALLATGDLAAAAAEVGRLDGPAAELASPWLGEAEARLAADRALAGLTGDALAGLAASALPPAGDGSDGNRGEAAPPASGTGG